MNYIVETIEEFFAKLDKLRRDLEPFSIQFDNRSAKIYPLLDNFKQKIFASKGAATVGKRNLNAVEQAAQRSLENIRNVIDEWDRKIKLDKEKQDFIRENEKYLVVMIFGGVKAGKSTLGNFFAGKKLIDAPFDNPYKHLEGDRKAIFKIQDDKGRQVGNLQKDERGNTWFTEGYIDTTGAIQHFTLLKGLRWMDSPGTGAVAKKGDKKDMTALVEEFIPYTDMCIFLMNSSEPGLQDDMKYMQSLGKEGQEALIVITKSDRQEEDIDDDDNLIQVLVAKSEANRRMQEESICQRVKENYPDIDETKFRALSVSTALANEAIRQNDEEKFRASNLDKLMKKLGDKISADAVERKRSNQQRLLNSFIDGVIESLASIEKDVGEIPVEIDSFKSKMSDITRGIVESVVRKVRNEVNQCAGDWNDRVLSGSSVSNATISSTVEKILRRVLNDEINARMHRIISDYQSRELTTTKANLSAGSLEKQTTQIEHTYTETYTLEYLPDGIWNNIRSIFGKKFYKTEERTRTEYQTVDLGTNFTEFIDTLMPQVKSYAAAAATASLNQLRDTYFAEREAFARNALGEIKNLRAELLKLKS